MVRLRIGRLLGCIAMCAVLGRLRGGFRTVGALTVAVVALSTVAPAVAGDYGHPILFAGIRELGVQVSGERIVYAQPYYDVWVYDIARDVESRLSASSKASGQQVSGDNVVWHDGRNGNLDIFGYDLAYDSDHDGIPNYADANRPSPDPAEQPVCVASGDQGDPDVSSSHVVWIDNRDGDWDIRAKSLVTGAETVLDLAGDQVSPALWGSRVVYVDESQDGGDIWLYHLETGDVECLSCDPGPQSDPDIAGDIVTWQEPAAGGTRVFRLDVSSGVVKSLLVTVTTGVDYLRTDGEYVVWAGSATGDWHDNDIYLWDTVTGWVVPICDAPRWQTAPAIHAGRIVWQDYRRETCTYCNDTYLFDIPPRDQPMIEASIPPGWHLVSVPWVPVDASPSAVFAGWPLTGCLHRYDTTAQRYVTYYDFCPSQFGELKHGAGYWLCCFAPSSLAYSGYRYPWQDTLKVHIPQWGWSLFGHVFDSPIALANVEVRHGVAGPIPFAEAANVWIMDPLLYYDTGSHAYGSCGVLPIDTDNYLRPLRGYWLYTFVDDVTLEILPP